jgi:hypothetical protein
MNNMKKKIVIIVALALLAIGGGVFLYQWNKPKTNAANVTPNYVLPADSLGAAFAKNEDAANAKFVKDSVALEIQGTVDTTFINEGNESVIRLSTSTPDYPVNCYFNSTDKATANKGDQVVIKGFCTGYLMMDGVQMSKCARIK